MPVQVDVIDNGRGIPDDIRNHFLTLLYRGVMAAVGSA